MHDDASQALRVLEVAGRVFLGLLYAYGGYRHVRLFKMTLPRLAARGLPAPGPLLALGTAFQIVAGLSLAAGFWVTPAALSLIVFTLIGSYLILDFWNKEGLERILVLSIAQSNAGVIGGLLLLAARG